MKKYISKLPCQKDERIIELIKEFESASEQQAQIVKAFEKPEWFQKWGRHHIPSLVRAHQL